MPTNPPAFRAILMENIDDVILENQKKINELNIKIADKVSDIITTSEELVATTQQILEGSKEILNDTQDVLDKSEKILNIF